MTASVTLTLDTRPPVVSVVAPSRVEPSEDLPVRVVSNEPLGPVSILLVTVMGQRMSLGFHRPDERTITLTVPTGALPGGPSTLYLTLADEVLNLVEKQVAFEVVRPEAHFDVDLDIANAHEVTLTLNGGYDVELTVENGHESDLYLDDAYEAVLDLEPAHQITLEVY